MGFLSPDISLMKAFCVLRRATLVALLLAGPAGAATINAQLEQAARVQLERMAQANALSEPQLDVAVSTPRAAPPCARPPEIEPLDTRQPARLRFVVRCPVEGGWRYEYVVRGRISAMVAVAAAPVAAGEPLSEALVTLDRRDVTLIPDALGAPDAALGQTSRRSLRPGDVLRAGQLASPVLVKRGDPVLMVARRDEVEVSTAGEALDSGARGASVRVRNPSSGQVVRMRVTGAGTVEPVGTARISR
jgi:flagellar basal body P-ring formation protein FlgA